MDVEGDPMGIIEDTEIWSSYMHTPKCIPGNETLKILIAVRKTDIMRVKKNKNKNKETNKNKERVLANSGLCCPDRPHIEKKNKKTNVIST